MSAPPTPAGAPTRGSAVALAAILLVHLAVSARTIPPATLLIAEPFSADDYPLRFARAATVASTLPHTGRLWTYDPSHMAGPGGVVLKYRWYPGFCSDPPLPVRPFHAVDIAAPFIAVDNGTARAFTLRPTRGWGGGCG